MTDIRWMCHQCDKTATQEMHTNPEAHFVAMICNHCGHEEEGCFCWTTDAREQFRHWGALGGARTKGKGGPSKRRGDSEYYRRLAARRKSREDQNK